MASDRAASRISIRAFLVFAAPTLALACMATASRPVRAQDGVGTRIGVDGAVMAVPREAKGRACVRFVVPAHAVITVDGEPLEKGEGLCTELEPGRREVRITSTDGCFEEWSRTLQASLGTFLEVQPKFKRTTRPLSITAENAWGWPVHCEVQHKGSVIGDTSNGVEFPRCVDMEFELQCPGYVLWNSSMETLNRTAERRDGVFRVLLRSTAPERDAAPGRIPDARKGDAHRALEDLKRHLGPSEKLDELGGETRNRLRIDEGGLIIEETTIIEPGALEQRRQFARQWARARSDPEPKDLFRRRLWSVAVGRLLRAAAVFRCHVTDAVGIPDSVEPTERASAERACADTYSDDELPPRKFRSAYFGAPGSPGFEQVLAAREAAIRAGLFGDYAELYIAAEELVIALRVMVKRTTLDTYGGTRELEPELLVTGILRVPRERVFRNAWGNINKAFEGDPDALNAFGASWVVQ